MAWGWLAWRCFDNIRETFEEKGWEYRSAGRDGNEMMPLLAESGDCCVVFFERDASTNECWFELRDEARGRVMYVRGAENIPGPEKAAGLLAEHGWPLNAVAVARNQPLYSLPVAPVMEVG